MDLQRLSSMLQQEQQQNISSNLNLFSKQQKRSGSQPVVNVHSDSITTSTNSFYENDTGGGNSKRSSTISTTSSLADNKKVNPSFNPSITSNTRHPAFKEPTIDIRRSADISGVSDYGSSLSSSSSDKNRLDHTLIINDVPIVWTKELALKDIGINLPPSCCPDKYCISRKKPSQKLSRERVSVIKLGFADVKQDSALWYECQQNTPPSFYYPPMVGGSAPTCKKCLKKIIISNHFQAKDDNDDNSDNDTILDAQEIKEMAKYHSQACVSPQDCTYCCLGINAREVHLLGYKDLFSKRLPPLPLVPGQESMSTSSGGSSGLNWTTDSFNLPLPDLKAENDKDHLDIIPRLGGGHYMLVTKVDQTKLEQEDEENPKIEDGEPEELESEVVGDQGESNDKDLIQGRGNGRMGNFRGYGNRPGINRPRSSSGLGLSLGLGLLAGGLVAARPPPPLLPRYVSDDGLYYDPNNVYLSSRPYSYRPYYTHTDPYYVSHPRHVQNGHFIGAHYQNNSGTTVLALNNISPSEAHGIRHLGFQECYIVKPPRLGSKKFQRLILSLNTQQQQQIYTATTTTEAASVATKSQILSAADVYNHCYVDISKPAPWSNPSFWWYTGKNLMRYIPVNKNVSHSRNVLRLSLPQPVNDYYGPGEANILINDTSVTTTTTSTVITSRPLHKTASSLKVYIGRKDYKGRPLEKRCCAIDGKYQIKCPYQSTPANKCPCCQNTHYCSDTHRLYVTKTTLALLRELESDNGDGDSIVKSNQKNSEYYYCPVQNELWRVRQ